MKLVEINWNPEERILRQFGYLTLVLLPLAGWFFLHRPNPLALTPGETRTLGILVGIGLVAAITGTIKPSLLKPVFIGACLVALPIGLVVSEVVMLVIYFLVFLPVALVFRMIGRDALERGIDRNAKTYWQPKVLSDRAESYFHQS